MDGIFFALRNDAIFRNVSADDDKGVIFLYNGGTKGFEK